MEAKTISIETRVWKFAKKVRGNFADSQVYLFGSRARGDHLKDSDYDFIIVSKHFEGEDFLDRMTRVLRLTKAGFAVEILCYTPAEFAVKKRQIGTVQSAMKEAIRI